MNLFLIALFSATLLSVSSSPATERANAAKWEAFKNKHHKRYANPAEEATRKTNFHNLDALVEAINSDPTSTFTASHNHMSDWTDEEKSRLRGAVVPSNGVRLIETPLVELADRALPTSYDLRTAKVGCVQGIKDQGQCGSCWAFSATASLECAYFLKYGKSANLSEQELVDCDTTDYGCNGGWPKYAWAFLKSKGGSQSQSSYPYTSGTTQTAGTCKFPSSQVVAKVSSYNQMNFNRQPVLTLSQMQNALITNGPLSVAIDASSFAFQVYSSGLYNPTSCSSNGKTVDHAVNIIGYGSNYWIVRNSWGTGWGMQGYFQIASGVNKCNIESFVGYVVAA